MRRGRLPLAALAFCLGVLPAIAVRAEITAIVIERTESFAGGMTFGEPGAYVRLTGIAKGELDPRDPRNKAIVDLDKAPRNARGMVEYDTDIDILRPADPAAGNGRLLYEVSNRGNKFLLPMLDRAPATAPFSVNDPRTVENAGTGWVFRQGYTVVWSGWDPSASSEGQRLTIRVPVVSNGGTPIVREIREEFVYGTRVPTTLAAAPLSYEAADLDPVKARLTVRAREAETPQPIPAGGWAYAGARAIKLLPEGTAFKPGYIYDFRYPAKNPRVMGVGFAATRDVVSFLRYGTQDAAGHSNPLLTPDGKNPARYALAFGISQSGRYLRDHVGGGFNADEHGRKVFDGVLAHISGIGKMFLNIEYAQPFRTSTQHEDHDFPENWFPFAHGVLHDPVTGKTAGLLRNDGSDPLVIETNTATEYWQKGASLLATDPLGRHDIKIPAGVRLFMIAGTQHGGRPFLDTSAGNCSNPRNPNDPSPVLRALLVDLDQWVSAGTPPPASRIPRLADGTLVDAERTGFPKVPGMAIAEHGNRLMLHGDWRAPRPMPSKAYRSMVSRVGADGNEVAGVRMPAIAAPLATYTGWNLYKAPYPEGELCDRDGSYVPLPKTGAEAAAKSDPRPSLEVLYGNRDGYLRRLSAATDALVAARLLLPEDAERILQEGRETDPFAN